MARKKKGHVNERGPQTKENGINEENGLTGEQTQSQHNSANEGDTTTEDYATAGDQTAAGCKSSAKHNSTANDGDTVHKSIELQDESQDHGDDGLGETKPDSNIAKEDETTEAIIKELFGNDLSAQSTSNCGGEFQLSISNELCSSLFSAFLAYHQHDVTVKEEQALRKQDYRLYEERSAQVDKILNDFEDVGAALQNRASTLNDYNKMKKVSIGMKRPRLILDILHAKMADLRQNNFVGGTKVEKCRERIIERALILLPLLEKALNEPSGGDDRFKPEIPHGASSTACTELHEQIDGPDKEALTPDFYSPEVSQIIFSNKYLQLKQSTDEVDANLEVYGLVNDAAFNQCCDEIHRAFDELQQKRRKLSNETKDGTEDGKKQAEIELIRAVLQARCWGLPVNRDGFLPLPNVKECDKSGGTGVSSDVQFDDGLEGLLEKEIESRLLNFEGTGSEDNTKDASSPVGDQAHDASNAALSSQDQEKEGVQNEEVGTRASSSQLREDVGLIKALKQARTLHLGEVRKRKAAEQRVQVVEEELRDLKRLKNEQAE